MCGSLSVYENRVAQRGRQIRLRIAVIPADDRVPQADPVFFLAGGPGGAATESWASAGQIFVALHQHRDFVLVDQRGTGGSHQLTYPSPPDLGGLPPDQVQARARQWVAEVIAGLDGDPTLYMTSLAMDDLDQVRQALGYHRIDLYGGSYGATAAQYYVRQHGNYVRTVVLDGGSLLNAPLLELLAANSQAALNRIFDRCDGDAACSAAYPAVRQELATVIQRLQARPVTITTSAGGAGTAVIDADAFAATIHSLLLSATTAASIPQVIHQAATGDFAKVGQAIANNTDSTSNLVMSAMIKCFEGWAKFDPVETQRLGTGSYLLGFEEKIAQGQALVCPLLPKPNLAKGDGLPLQSPVPVLLLNGSTDPQDPPSNVAAAPIDLPNSLSIVVPDQGHTVGHLGCLPTIVAAFVAAGSAKHLDIACVRSVSVPPFALP